MNLKKFNDFEINGEQVVQSFLSAATNLTTASSARLYASDAENDTRKMLEQLQAGNGLYLTANDIPEDKKQQLITSSLDSHIKKIQSEQIEDSAIKQTQQDQTNLEKILKGKRLTINSIGNTKPFQAVWQDPKTGNLNPTPINSKQIKGTIEELSLEYNYIVVKTSNTSRLLTPRRHFFITQVIDPQTLSPMVNIFF